ncbi:integral membrane protein 2B-like [Gigantopelta aegis]|uniref:integral membrane protein 2B-like n=1 Tax=Gigantopelta aegis TaxID=1735272 RepID=UPI001B889DC3|nr:integral membrane protein 2B-like [Gigantopelta aegis]
MTIYKLAATEKKAEKDAEVLHEPLTGEKDELELDVATPKLVRVTYGQHRARTYVNLCLIITALIVLGSGIIGAVFLYKHLAHRNIIAKCGVTYFDEVYHSQANFLRGGDDVPNAHEPGYDYQNEGVDFFEEDVEVSEVQGFERLTIPRFDECEETVVWHDFIKNYTAIVDHLHETCYVMKLNRTLIAPPKDMIDLISKFQHGEYLPKVDVLREMYQVVTPAVGNLKALGPFIMRECYWYETYRLEKFVKGVYKRSAEKTEKHVVKESHFGFPTGKGLLLKMTVLQEV